MNREELIKEIDNATRAMRITTRVVNESLCHARHYKSNEETEEAYNKGLEDVWKILKAFCGMDVWERQEVFGEYVVGKLVENMSPQEALAKLEAYEKEQNEIKVGEVVEQNGHKFVIIFVNGEYVNGIDEDGRFSNISIKNCKKTSKHIDITSVLEQLRGE